MKKAYRQKKIREIITARSIERQEDLVGALNELGLQVTQATISRDIKEMQLIKVPAENGGYRYALPVMQHRDEPDHIYQVPNHKSHLLAIYIICHLSLVFVCRFLVRSHVCLCCHVSSICLHLRLLKIN